MPDRTFFAPGVPRTLPLPFTIAAAGDNAIVQVADRPIYVWKMLFVVAAAVTLSLKNGVGGALLLPGIGYVANGSLFLPYDSEPWFATDRGNAFVIALSGNVQVVGTLYYTTAALS